MWQPDVLGDRFQQLTLPLTPDDEGEVVATLVRYRPGIRLDLPWQPAAGADVLYIHGWSDYFFQTELAEFWNKAGARFFALDLRKYGRSLRPHQTPGYITDLAHYDEDIDAALDAMGHSGRPLIVMGHSTGGLTLSLWAARHPGRVAAVVLNSPWLEFQGRAGGRAAIAPLIGLQAKYRPRDDLPRVDFGFYTRSVSKQFDGDWDYDLDWRPERGFVVHPGWLNAILVGHAKVAMGLNIQAPILTMLSATSMLTPRWDDGMKEADVALDVDVVARRALLIGDTVTMLRVRGALHDIVLSKPVVREHAYRELARWLRAYGTVHHPDH
jgi:alpha-beta hydrolase superfamily lysophospholipase